MKIRNGFVSNSSSSSFIVNFGKPIRSADDLMDVLNWDEFHKEWDALLENDRNIYKDSKYVDYFAKQSDRDIANFIWHMITSYEKWMDIYNKDGKSNIHTFNGLVRNLFYDEEFMTPEEMHSYGMVTYDDIIEKLHTDRLDTVKGFEADSEATGFYEEYRDGNLSQEDWLLFMELYSNGMLFLLFKGLPYVYENFH